MTLNSILNSAKIRLTEISETPFLDALVLFSKASKHTKEKLLSMLQEEIPEEIIYEFNILLEQRLTNRPIAYILGEKEFYGREFYVGEGVLVPRPDTEVLVEEALSIIDSHYNLGCEVLDLCTGTGCIGLTLKLERPYINLTASDISQNSDIFFKKNTNRHKIQTSFIQSNLFDSINQKFDIIATNPPYLTNNESDEKIAERWKEPDLALRGGDDGLDLIRKIIKDSIDYLNPDGYILIESSSQQTNIIKNLLEEAGFYDTKIIKDLAGMQRVTVGRI
ncbi:MAG: peptide chain release factor N(5)-glutamine methyltransferase [Spirochaetales bacterium]|nr:peptide chain release factor N(5)-glutamine methyltransferase [Spirochaetales bacterium]